MHIDIHVHGVGAADDDKLNHIITMLATLIRKEEQMSAAFDRLTASVAQVNGKADSLITLTTGLADFIRANAENPTALNAMADSLDNESAKVQAAIDANPLPTDVPPVPPTA